MKFKTSINGTDWNDTPAFTDFTECVVCSTSALCLTDTCDECLQDQKEEDETDS